MKCCETVFFYLAAAGAAPAAAFGASRFSTGLLKRKETFVKKAIKNYTKQNFGANNQNFFTLTCPYCPVPIVITMRLLTKNLSKSQ